MITRYSPVRELARRESVGIEVTLLWRQGTRKLWLKVWETTLDVTLVIPVKPERALDAFHHPYAYASRPSGAGPAEPLAA
jgi:hypothetical protein